MLPTFAFVLLWMTFLLGCLHNCVVKPFTYRMLKATCSLLVTNLADNLTLQLLQFVKVGVCREVPGGAGRC